MECNTVQYVGLYVGPINLLAGDIYMETVLDFRSFDPRFKTALIFSIFEGLLAGKGFSLISDQDPQLIRDQFEKAKVSNCEVVTNRCHDGVWEVKISKIEGKRKDGGCCGVCGGDGKI